jgi:hypothetical protein
MQLGATSFTLDGEAVVCGPDGIAIFDALHRRCTVSEAMLYAFDLLELDGEDLRSPPLGDRKKRLATLVGKRRRDRLQRAHRRGRRGDLPAGLQEGFGGDRLEAAGRALPLTPVAGLNQGREPGQPGDDPGTGSRVVKYRRALVLRARYRGVSLSGVHRRA